MKKESTFAVVLGVLMGAIVALILIFQNKQIQLEKNKTIAPKTTITPSVAFNNTDLQSFVISNPGDGAIVDANSINIEGKAPNDALIVIQSPAKEIIIKSNKNQFKTTFPLAYGENVINITFYPKDPQMRSQEKRIRVYYLNNQL